MSSWARIAVAAVLVAAAAAAVLMLSAADDAAPGSDETGSEKVEGGLTAGALAVTRTDRDTSPEIHVLPDGRQPVAATATAAHWCVLDNHGDAWCTGDGTDGRLGNGDRTSTSHLTPMSAPAGTSWAAIAAGPTSTCAIADADGTVWCAGAGSGGRLGTGDDRDRAVPTRVGGLEQARSVAVGASHACAVDGDGRLWCWGRGAHGKTGQDGGGQSVAPAPVESSHTWDAVTVGTWHTCAITTDGHIACFGWAEAGRLGTSRAATTAIPTPIDVPPVLFDHVAAGDAHTCALDSDGAVWCWGANDVGQTGVGQTGGSSTPQRVLEHAEALTVGSSHTCALIGGELWCWGLLPEGPAAAPTATGLHADGAAAGAVHTVRWVAP